MVGRDVIHCVCALLVLFAHLNTGHGDMVSGNARIEQARQASRDVMRESVEEVFYNTGLQESRRRNNGHQAALEPETSTKSTEIGTSHRNDILQSPPSLHPENQHVAQTHRNMYRESPHDTTSQLPSSCLHKPDQRACGAPSKRYFFDQTTMECYKFIHGGCRGNGNNFETLISCNFACLGHE